MAPATLDKLRRQAKKLGVSAKEIRSADRDELQTLIADAQGNGKPRKKSTARKAVRKAVRKSSAVAKKSVPAKSRKSGTAKRQTTRRKATSNGNGYVAKGGRNTLDGVNFSETDGWNPRPGSAPDRIIKALRKFKGNRAKTYEFLLPDIGDFVKPKKSDGSAWEKGDGPGTRKGMLKYRISRTAWQFALQTEQHESAANRVTYGTGGTGQGIFKPANKRKASTSTKSTKATRSTKTKATGRKTTKATARRQKATAKRTSTTKARKAGRKAARKR